MTGTPIPAGALTVDDGPNGTVYGVRWVVNGIILCWVNDWERDRLLSPPRPTGVPDDAERLIAEARYEATKHRAIHARLRSGDDLAVAS